MRFMAHKDLNEDWFWMMEKNDPQDYANNIARSDPGGYQHCGGPLARQVATETNYISSFTSGNKEENEWLLERLSMEYAWVPPLGGASRSQGLVPPWQTTSRW